ncbi:uncharacterized membrane protein YjgN (DUF898 family) [Clostridium tetanomorphum]|uniref:DUF898 domain-containing protein n=1 Tax=Clostridium tetanomorphum TaxID=1553 RepID=A0A923E8B0_CLOTT|nr:hypothetical protein [Clostridium tetanomorphum]KAJ49190.1 hypothetical protein CTM_24478 [Clostridium tetanomorphum DSM 665]KAJ50503.1 hypothetical protein CTM_17846 [Clostridium tetanomorphum DSM 665]MBC2398293.1 DUF898 domain-containing protein [Clostridium tetanomorphum]MBP1865589.1 uncharacterized membrane protein YjgN (DUF898 family) [Clostridium tetanomorphum]NRS85905.1 uncharacterized membrane protein YjgN (DUF898 family) [Clostridium tetanomorphum]
MENTALNINTNTVSESYFDGGLLELIAWTLLGALITIFTLGICYHWALCMVFGWKINHTVVNGRRLKFNGTALGLFGNWVKWFLLTLITLGIYGFWLGIALEKWKVKNTTFAN